MLTMRDVPTRYRSSGDRANEPWKYIPLKTGPLMLLLLQQRQFHRQTMRLRIQQGILDMEWCHWHLFLILKRNFLFFPSIFTGRHEVSDPHHQPRVSQNSDGIPCSCSSSGERMGDVLPGIRAELPCERIPFPLWLQRANSDISPSRPERVRWLRCQKLDFR